ncbi:MAG TPA: YceH family protein [Burkholderiales bacterium]|nr:YceH family protein [Burkholderiales bacterium]
MTAAALPLLSPLEIRVLGVLVEKQLTTPDYYPLSLNALVAGCNQKSSRDPVMSIGEQEAQNALDALKERKLVTNSWGASRRVMRYSHNFPQVLDTDPGTTALLATLMLRGPQTPGELRIACERMYHFADLSSVEAYLEAIAGRAAGALVVKLPKQPGAREHRWGQLLGGPADAPTDPPAMHAGAATIAGSGFESEVARLRDEVAELRAMVERLREEIKK